MGVPKHGRIKVSTLKLAHAKRHLAQMVTHAQIAADYGGHGGPFSQQGEFSAGGASGGPDYTTFSVTDSPTESEGH